MVKFFSTFLIVHFVLFLNSVNAQTPGGLNYQGVARNQYMTGLNNKTITLRFSIRENTVAGPVLYTETRNTQTDSFGVFSVVIGSAGATSQSGSIKQVPWSNATKKFLQVELDINEFPSTGLLNMGTTQLLSVPFSFYSDVSDSTRISDSTRGAAKAAWAKYSEGSGQYFFSAMVDPFGSQAIPVSANGEYSVYDVPVRFAVVLVNEKDGYNPTTGEFTAPDDGFYAFGVTINEAMIKYEEAIDMTVGLQFALCKNGKVIRSLGSIYRYVNENGNSSYDFEPIEQNSILKLLKGDKVSVRLYNYSEIPVFFGLNYTSEDLSYINDNYDVQAFMEFNGHKIK